MQRRKLGVLNIPPMRPEVGEPGDEEPVNGTGMELRGRGGAPSTLNQNHSLDAPPTNDSRWEGDLDHAICHRPGGRTALIGPT